MRKVLLSICPVLLLLAASCGGGDDAPALPPAGSSTAPALTASATLTGRILFDGVAPAPAPIQMSADPKCPQGDPTALSQDVLVGDGGLQNVMIYISSGMDGLSFPVPTEAAIVDQNGCRYVPHVQTVQVNQPVTIRNSDDTLHNIHARENDTTLFNFGQPVMNSEQTRTFDRPQVVRMVCDVHKWMSAFIGVFSHPFHTVSGETGQYTLPIPAGVYEVTAWHERYGTQTQTIEVSEGGAAELNFTFSDTGA